VSELPYRSEQVGVRLVNRGSTFWSRFRLLLKASRGLLILYVGACLAIGLVLLGGMGLLVWLSPAYDSAEARGWFVTGAMILAATLGAGLATMVATAAFRSVSTDPAEQLFPRELHLFEDHVMVVPFDGPVFRTPWSAYVLAATMAPGGVWLLLGREPRLEFFVRREALTAHDWSQLNRWLAAQDLLGG
jgi:hypothetical protein